jgi:hypothetical protein
MTAGTVAYRFGPGGLGQAAGERKGGRPKREMGHRIRKERKGLRRDGLPVRVRGVRVLFSNSFPSSYLKTGLKTKFKFILS